MIVVAILAIGFLLSGKYPLFNGSRNNLSAVVTVENTPMVDGVLPVPPGFPPEIPLENGEILESATTWYPIEDVTQLSLSYRSSKTAAQKYAEYKNYMDQAGYSVTEGDFSSATKAVFGTQAKANLSVVISSADGATLVQLSYLLK